MTIDELRQLFGATTPIIGMLHLRPLPGSPRAEPISVIRERMLEDLEALMQGGVDGVILENYGDAPYFPGRVPPHTVSCLTRLALEVRGTDFAAPGSQRAAERRHCCSWLWPQRWARNSSG